MKWCFVLILAIYPVRDFDDALRCVTEWMVAPAAAQSNGADEGKPDKVPMPSSVATISNDRVELPLYRTIPAINSSALTLATNRHSEHRSWARSNADSANTRYSSLKQINRQNVGRLEVAWIYRSGGIDYKNIQANPVIVDDTLYAPAAGKIVVALNARTGAELWRFRPPPTSESFGENYGPAHRGLVYWAGQGHHAPRLFLTANGYLFAVDPKNGRPVQSFGDGGRVRAKGPVAPVIYRDIILVSDLATVSAFDVVTGRLLWNFATITRKSEQTLGDSYRDGVRHEYPGGSVWGGMALDEQRGLVFFSTGAPHPNFVGIDRPGNNEHTNSIVALDARGGQLVWAFQDIPHDLWDLDIPAPPNLVTVTSRGKRVDAVAQVTKQGNTLLLDRLSGKPLFPLRYRRAPASTLPGEHTAQYQLDLQLPQPFSPQEFRREDITNLSAEARDFVSKQLERAVFGWFEPPHEGRPIVYYGVHGGAEWSGAAFDPVSGLLYVSANEIAWLASVVRTEAPHRPEPSSAGNAIYTEHCASCHGENRAGRGMAPSLLGIDQSLSVQQVTAVVTNGKNSMPPIQLPHETIQQLMSFLFNRDAGSERGAASSRRVYVDGMLTPLLDNRGYPGSRPPWGTLNAIDLNTGMLRWKVPLGEHEELTREGIAKTGTQNFGGAMVTAGGLVFCAGTRDMKIRAFDQTTGKELWQHMLPYGGYAPPATYEVEGRQYVVIAATGGGKQGGPHGDAYVAFALPHGD